MNIGSINSKVIYEDEEILVIMKESPKENGHLLLTTKKHIDDFMQIDDNLVMNIYKVLKEMKNLLYDRLNPNGLKIINNYGDENLYNAFYLDIIPVYVPKQPLVDIDIIYDKLK